MILRKWNVKSHTYEPYEIPDDWKIPLIDDNMDEIVNCVQCGKELPFGDGYTSLEVHTEIGIGYTVCHECYQKEIERKTKSKETEQLLKIQKEIDKTMYHLTVTLKDELWCEWSLYFYYPDIKDYFSSNNRSILTSEVDSLTDLIDYLMKHNGFKKN